MKADFLWAAFEIFLGVESSSSFLAPTMLSQTLGQGSLAEGGRISTVDLLVLTRLDKLLFKLKILYTFFTK